MMRVIARLPLFTTILAFFFSSFAATAGSDESGPFKPGDMITHHVADAHEIHIIGDLAIYLPVILKTETGWDIFSSSHFYHNPRKAEMDGHTIDYYAYGDYIMFHEAIYYKGTDSDIAGVTADGHLTNAKPFDISITKSVFGFLLIGFLMVLMFGSIAKAYKKREGMAPKGLQSFMEPLILFVRDEVAIPAIGKHKANFFLPFLLTIFFLIWMSNLLGLIPFLGGFNITGTIGVTLALAGLVFLLQMLKSNKYFWGHILWPPGVPLGIKFIMVPIEVLGLFLKPTVLMIRLTANIAAGHIIILAFVSLIFIFRENGAGVAYGVGLGSTLFMIFMFAIELLVAFLQAYVFTLLAAIYFGDAVHEPHHHH
jgi:F-type H+-transporting ATPase subunit a